MASFVYITALKEIMDATLDLSADTLKVMLVNSIYSGGATHDDDVVDAGDSNDPIDGEISATNYTGGWGGSGRKTLASKTFTADKANNRAEFDAADVVWTSLGGAANDTITAAIIIKEGVSDDTTSRLIAFLDHADLTTNGGDFTLQWDAEGIIHFVST